MKIAIEGCAHGELEKIYDTLKHLEEKNGFKVDLLLCCGDFQASRNEEDLRCMAVPPKYYNLCTFYKYYSGEKLAPVLTVFIGGNHEASNYLQELPYGGWVAPNIYYLGYAGVINVGGLRIGGISGIYKGNDYMKGHFEHSPYTDSTKRSVYHIRNLEVFRMKQITEHVDVFLSHDWPSGVWEYGNKAQLLRFKPFFEADMESGKLGSKPAEELLSALKPDYWFAAHLHCKFAAIIPHEEGKTTKFLALDKCLPRRRFLQVVDVPHEGNMTEVKYDLEWLTVLRLTNHLLSVKNVFNYMPGPSSNERWCFSPTEDEKSFTLERLGNNLLIPSNFEKTAVGYSGQKSKTFKQPEAISNKQTELFCKTLSIDDPLSLIPNLNISANIVEDEANVTDNSIDKTFIDDTDIVLDCSVPKGISLNLPEPIGNTENFEETSEKRKSPYREETPEKIENEDSISEPSFSKKFKRRNASIYQHEDV